jgi:uncharacterized protein (DUF885 family)
MYHKILISFFVFFISFPLANLYSYEDMLTYEQIEGSLEQNRMNDVLERYIATIVMYDPERASSLGIHDNDHLLTSRTNETINEQIKSLDKLKSDLEKINKEKMYTYLQADYFLLNSMLEVDIYNLRNMNLLSKYPQNYLSPLDLIYTQMNKETGNYMLKAANSIKRLNEYPRILLEAERNINHPPKIWTEYTIDKTQIIIDNISDFYPLFKNYIKYDPTLKTQLDKTLENLKYALEKYRDFLKEDILKKADGEAAIGEYTYGFYLERWHGLDFNTASAYRYAKKFYKKAIKDLNEEAKKLDPMVYKSGGWHGVFKSIKRDAPPLTELLKTITDEFIRSSNHFDEYKVFNYPKMKLQIKPMPFFLRQSWPYSFYYPPLPFESDKSGELYITLPDEKEEKGKLNSIMFSMYSYSNIELLTSGLLIPGSHLSYFEIYKNNSRIRKVSNQKILINGWQLYAEDLANEMGYYSTTTSNFLRLYVLAIHALRAYVDVGYHIGDLSYDEAVGLFMKDLKFSEAQAKREVLDISMNPTIALTYIVGYDTLLKLRKSYMKTEDKFFDLRSYHNDLLQLGNISVNYLDEQLKLLRKIARKKIQQENQEEDE